MGRETSGIDKPHCRASGFTPPFFWSWFFAGTRRPPVKTILELQDDHSHLVKSAKDITNKADKENRALSEGEAKDVDDFLNRSKETQKDIKALEADQKRRKEVQEASDALGTSTPRVTGATTESDEPKVEERVFAMPKGNYRHGKLKAFTGKDAEYNAYKSGQWFRAAILGNHRAQTWCQKNGVEFRAAMSEGINTAGGVLVPSEMEQTIITLREDYGVFRANTRVRPMGRDTLLIPRRTAGLTAYWVGEGVAITASDMALDQVQLVAKKLATLTYLSTELDEDAIVSIIDALTQEIALALATMEDTCGFTGAGNATHGGIWGLTNRILDAANTTGAVDCVTAGHDTFAEVDNADLAALMGKLPVYALRNAKFYCSQIAKALVFGRLKAVAGGNTVETLSGGVQDTYLGYPIVVSQVLPTSTGDLNNLPMLFFGDLSLAASMGDRRGISVMQDRSIKFVEDQIAVKATERIDINIHDLGTTSVAGPIVGLIGFTS